jgi:hypothetical protein
MAARRKVAVARLAGWLALLLCTGLCSCLKQVERRWPAGTPRFAGSVSRLAGTREGLWTFWFPSGEPREQGRYSGGLRVGRWKQWHANGQPRSEGERESDPALWSSPRTGCWRFWFESGELEAQGVFVHGMRAGHWDYHLTDGELDGDRSGEYHLDQILR